ncbi:MAG: RIP metalloprotease RseP [Bacteriovoracia bacterium]
MLFYVASFLLLLGPLVFVHELGHFIFAKLFNVRVDVFSMGFGPKIFNRKWGETEYCVSLIPLGGYVKLFGQDPTEVVTPENKKRALNSQEAWKRFLIFVAGPLFNFIFAILVFALMLVLGEPHLGPVLSRVVPKSQAEVAGFRSGDVITSINRTVITNFDEVSKIVSESANKELSFRVKRQNKTREIKVVPHPGPGLSIYGEPIEVGIVDGMNPFGRATTIGISNPHSLAAKAGLKTGDEIVAVNDRSVSSFEDLEKVFASELKTNSKQFILKIRSNDIKTWVAETSAISKNKGPTTDITVPAKPLSDLGIFSSELFVASVLKDSPAEKAGVLVGDRIASFDQKRIEAFDSLKEMVQAAGDADSSFVLSIERDGKLLSFDITPMANETKDITGKDVKRFVMGVVPLFVQAEPTLFIERIFNPYTLTLEAWSRAIDLSVKTVVSIKKLFTRQVSVNSLGGPILIGKLAGDSMSRGLAAFLKVMAIISISLAIFNILPVPILDGGHIFLLFVEVIRGRPISMRQTEVVQQVGLSLIVLLLVVVLFNDFSRVGIPALKSFFQ